MTMRLHLKKETLVAISVGLIVGILIVLLKESRENRYLVPVIWLTLWIGFVIEVVLTKETRKAWAPLYSLACSFFLAGLGQLIYKKQVYKFLVLSTSIIGLFFYLFFVSEFIPRFFVSTLFGEFPRPSVDAFLFLLLIGLNIYNLWDAYKVGEKYFKGK